MKETKIHDLFTVFSNADTPILSTYCRKNLYIKLRNAWYGLQSLFDINFEELMKCPYNCDYIQADG